MLSLFFFFLPIILFLMTNANPFCFRDRGPLGKTNGVFQRPKCMEISKRTYLPSQNMSQKLETESRKLEAANPIKNYLPQLLYNLTLL